MSKKIKSAASKTAKFFSGKGFYIALALCVTAIGISCYYLYATVNGFLDPQAEETDSLLGEEVSGSVDLTIPESSEDVLDSDSAYIQDTISQPDEPDESIEEVIEPVEPQPEDDPPAAVDEADSEADTAGTGAEQPEQTSVSQLYVWPIAEGIVVTEYDPTQLTYNRTTHDWRIHDGVDIAAAVGSHVMAVSSGTVTSVTNDPLEGTCVTIDHGSGMVSRYVGLQSIPTVNEGDQVITGDVIGAVGTTNTLESLDSSHLHFELTLNEMSVDPHDYLPDIM